MYTNNEIKTVGTCPLCKGDLIEIEGDKWACVNKTTGLCKFEIKNEFKGIKLTQKDLDSFASLNFFNELFEIVRHEATIFTKKIRNICCSCPNCGNKSRSGIYAKDNIGFFSCQNENCIDRVNTKYKGVQLSQYEMTEILRHGCSKKHTFTFRDENNNKVLKEGYVVLQSEKGNILSNPSTRLNVNKFMFVEEKYDVIEAISDAYRIPKKAPR